MKTLTIRRINVSINYLNDFFTGRWRLRTLRVHAVSGILVGQWKKKKLVSHMIISFETIKFSSSTCWYFNLLSLITKLSSFSLRSLVLAKVCLVTWYKKKNIQHILATPLAKSNVTWIIIELVEMTYKISTSDSFIYHKLHCSCQ